MALEASAAFHAHLDACKRCNQQPFNLCEAGKALLGATTDVQLEAHVAMHLAAFTLKSPASWPLRVMFPLKHTNRTDAYGAALCGFVAVGHSATLYLGNVGDVTRDDLQSRPAFESALRRFQSLRYTSIEALLADGWSLD